MQLLQRVFGLGTGRLLRTIHLVQGELRTTIWKALSYFVENYLVAVKRYLRADTGSEVRVILFPKIN